MNKPRLKLFVEIIKSRNEDVILPKIDILLIRIYDIFLCKSRRKYNIVVELYF
jgi:hypothetical protein